MSEMDNARKQYEKSRTRALAVEDQAWMAADQHVDVFVRLGQSLESINERDASLLMMACCLVAGRLKTLIASRLYTDTAEPTDE